VGDQVHFSDLNTAESITIPSLRIRFGAGDSILRLLPWREDKLLVFKGSVQGVGSIHVIDVASYNIVALFHDLPIVGAGAIVRVGVNDSSDVFYMTREGLRSLHTTEDGEITGPSLPVSYNIDDEVSGDIQWNQTPQSVHAIVFDDELLWFVPAVAATYPNKILAYTMRPPKTSGFQGWTKITSHPAFTAALIGFGGAKPHLYIGKNTGGIIQRAFDTATGTDSQYVEISKKITFNLPDEKPAWYHDKTPFKLIVLTGETHQGDLRISLLYENGEEAVLGIFQPSAGGLFLPFTLPASLGGAQITESTIECWYDQNNVAIHRSKDFRVKITSNDNPEIIGFWFQAFIERSRFIGLGNTEQVAVTGAGVQEADSDDDFTAGTIENANGILGEDVVAAANGGS